MSVSKHYDGTKLLSMTDINNNKPEIYICSGNRTGGKTTYFNRLLINKFKKYNSKFLLIYRYSYELDNVADKFFRDIQGLFFPDDIMTSKKICKGKFIQLFLNKKECGFAVSLNSADDVKKNSHYFNECDRMLFDEFQSEGNNYIDREVEKLISVHTSIARGKGKQIRYVPLYMVSNAVSLINPYYVELGISNRLKKETKFLKGEGFVLEYNININASTLQKESAFNRAFSANKYVDYSAQNIYLDDNNSFIENVSGKSRYLCTIKYKGIDYAIREYADLGIVYCDKNVDITFPLKISATTNDHSINYVMLKQFEILIMNLRFYFERGCFRFKDLMCKECILKVVSYK